MGKKLRGAALRAKKRADEAVEELQEQQAEKIASQSIVAKSDLDLFVLDTSGDNVPHSQRPPNKRKAEAKKKKQKGLSDKDKQQVEKLLKNHGKSAAKLEELAKKGRERLDQVRRRALAGRRTKASFDLWGSEDKNLIESNQMTAVSQVESKPGIGSTLAGTAPAHVVVKAQRIARKAAPLESAVAVDVAKAGQSYHPDPIAYKSIIDRAVNHEVNRQKASEFKDAPISQGLSAETRALLVGDSDSEDESDEEEQVNETDGTIPKQANKLTRAQRNKQKRLRQEKAELENRKKRKKLLNQVSEIPRYRKEIKREVREQKERKERIERGKDHQTRPLGKDVDKQLSQQDPINAPTYPVALSSELQSSLRSLKPKGSLVADRITSLMDRNLAPKRNMREGKKYAKGKRRKLSVKGRRNREAVGSDFVVMG